MGTAETGQASKMPPKGSATQEQSPVVSSSPAAIASSSSGVVYPDWSGFQAYSPVPPHGFFPPVASSPQTHPYMWGTQNMMAPYGTPPPPFVMYPHGGVYVHPSVSPAAHPFSPYTAPSPGGNPEGLNLTPEAEGKSSEGKEGNNLKRSNGSLGNLNPTARKAPRVIEKPSGASANGVFSHSESGSDGSSRGSDSDSPNDSPGKAAAVRVSGNGNKSKSPLNGDMTQQLAVLPALPGGTAGAVAGPTTNLNIGMDYWGAGAVATVRGKVHVPSNQSIPQELRLQDEREVKRERRKQSNRESARRSRLRKQAECEELAQRVEVLQQENASLAAEASRIRKEYEQLLSDNNSLKERLGQSSLEAEDSQQFRDEEGKAP